MVWRKYLTDTPDDAHSTGERGYHHLNISSIAFLYSMNIEKRGSTDLQTPLRIFLHDLSMKMVPVNKNDIEAAQQSGAHELVGLPRRGLSAGVGVGRSRERHRAEGAIRTSAGPWRSGWHQKRSVRRGHRVRARPRRRRATL